MFAESCNCKFIGFEYTGYSIHYFFFSSLNILPRFHTQGHIPGLWKSGIIVQNSTNVEVDSSYRQLYDGWEELQNDLDLKFHCDESGHTTAAVIQIDQDTKKTF